MITLGLDLGISSVGWAIIDETYHKRKLIAWGSRIFVPGVEGTENDICTGKGVSRCTERRLKRALRKQYLRRRERKNGLLELLTANGLLPQNVDSAFFTETDKKLFSLFPKTEHRYIGHILPYLWRKMALDRELEKYELGRAIYHLAQRRGYLSNRKQELKEQETAGIVKSRINELKQAIINSGARTLGEYFSMVDPETERIRSRYTEREMFQNEFRLICKKQRKHISMELEEKLFKAIFFQLKLKSCKGLIGKCRIYPDRRRCSMLAMEAQLFRIYTGVDNLRISGKSQTRSLFENERIKVIDTLNSFSDIFNKSGKITLGKLQKAVGLSKGEKFTLGEDEKEIYGNELHNILFRAFGQHAAEMSDDEKSKFINDLHSMEKNEVLLKRLTTYWKIDAEKAKDVASIPLPDKYCAFSMKALREMLPDLRSGVRLSDYLKNNNHTLIADKEFDTLPLLDECGFELRNPIVHRVLTEMRRVVNAVIKRYGKPDRIHVELARDLKATNKEREEITIRNRKREKERAAIAQRIAEEAGLEKISRNDILKVMLADECDFTCPYSGERFSMNELLHGGLIHIEHIIPYSRSFDDSFANKTLCINRLNAAKGNKTPHEAFGNTSGYREMLERVKHFKGVYAEKKLELFKLQEVEPSDFLERNLNDTRYASKLAMQYLAMLYGGIVDKNGKRRVYAIAGGCTALIRRAWGGNYILGEGEKVRSDHRHHAIDAMTVALTTPALVQKVAELSPERRREFSEKTKNFIDSAFYHQASAMLDECAVSHHVVNKMRGALHKETIYSKDYSNGQSIRHEGVAVKELDPDKIKAIVDPAIKKIILDKLGVSDENEVTGSMLKIFGDEANLPRMLDRSGNTVNIIKKVRISRKVNTRSIGKGDGKREVANGENYILAIFARLDEEGEEIGWEGEVVTLMDAIQRKQRKEEIFEKNRPGMKFKFSLQKGDIVKINRGGKEYLGVIRAFSSEIRIEYCSLTDARIKKDIQAAGQWNRQSLSTCFKEKLQKYNMNIFGELQTAND